MSAPARSARGGAGKFQFYAKNSATGLAVMRAKAKSWAHVPEVAKLYDARAKHYEELIEIYTEMAEDANSLADALDQELGNVA